MKLTPYEKMVKDFQARIKSKCSGKLRLRFVGLDGWDRPIFTDYSHPDMFFGDLKNIFSSADKEKIFEFYRERRHNLDRILTYFGEAFGEETWGIPLTGIDIKIAEG